jgi:hypothetical protein
MSCSSSEVQKYFVEELQYLLMLPLRIELVRFRPCSLDGRCGAYAEPISTV